MGSQVDHCCKLSSNPQPLHLAALGKNASVPCLPKDLTVVFLTSVGHCTVETAPSFLELKMAPYSLSSSTQTFHRDYRLLQTPVCNLLSAANLDQASKKFFLGFSRKVSSFHRRLHPLLSARDSALSHPHGSLQISKDTQCLRLEYPFSLHAPQLPK